MPALEQIIRPFTQQDVFPTPVYPSGASPQPLVHLRIGYPGGTKTFSTSASGSVSTRMGTAHRERAPTSGALKNLLSGTS